MKGVLHGVPTALIVVDVQNGFCHPDGSRARAVGPEAARPTFELVDRVVELIGLARRRRLPVWFTLMEYWQPDHLTGARRVRTGVDRRGSALDVCRAGTWDARLVDEVADLVEPADHQIVKHRSSAFYQTPLELQLRMAGITALVIAGTTTSYCVESTIRDAHARDFDVVVPAEAVADTDPAAQQASLAAIDRFHGFVCRLADVDELFEMPDA